MDVVKQEGLTVVDNFMSISKITWDYPGHDYQMGSEFSFVAERTEIPVVTKNPNCW